MVGSSGSLPLYSNRARAPERTKAIAGAAPCILGAMGEHRVRESDAREIRVFTRAVLEDLRALEEMLARGMIERDIRRIGVEQEMFLVDGAGRPMPVADRLLRELPDQRFTSELARFNLEAVLDPLPLRGSFLCDLQADLEKVLETVRHFSRAYGATALLVGILPSLRRDDLGLSNMSPEARYRQMNEALGRMRGGVFPVRISGIDEFDVTHDSVMIEAANTSLQLHLQVGDEEFPRLYNLAQLVTAPLLAACTNSLMLLGRRLWHETRVALFERSIDERSSAQLGRGLMARVTFGDRWLQGSVLEIFRENAARFHVIMTREAEPAPFAAVERGEVPSLVALCVHNGTVWRWNRPCYGVSNSSPHLRIENRVLPAGPTVLDEVANAALFYGMMLELDESYGDVSRRMLFEDAKANFLAAARYGIDAGFTWIDGNHILARDLLLEELIPAARRGLTRVAVPARDIGRYLDVVEERVRSGRTGSRWLLEALHQPDGQSPSDARVLAVTEAMLKHQDSGEPVHRWPVPSAISDLTGRERRPEQLRISDVMTRDLFTVLPEDVVDLAAAVMNWRHVRHVPVESVSGELVGLLTHRALLGALNADAELVAVEAIMDRAPVLVDPDLPVPEGMEKLLETETGCLLVVSRERLVGIVTERDLLRAGLELLQANVRS